MWRRVKRVGLRLRAKGFAIEYPGGFLGFGLDVRWSNIVEVRARRPKSPPSDEVQLYFRFRPGKPMEATISSEWPGFAEVRTAMETALMVLPKDWWTAATRLAPGEEILIYSEASVMHQLSDK